MFHPSHRRDVGYNGPLLSSLMKELVQSSNNEEHTGGYFIGVFVAVQRASMVFVQRAMDFLTIVV